VAGVGVFLLALLGMWASVVRKEEVETDTGGRKSIIVRLEPNPQPRDVPKSPNDKGKPKAIAEDKKKAKKKLAVQLIGEAHWRLEGDELVQPDASISLTALLFGDKAWTDYDIDVMAKRIQGPELCCLSFRVQDPFNYWVFGLGSGGGVREIGWSLNARFTRMMHEDWSPGDEWHRIGVSVRGDHIKCLLDGATLFDFSDGRYPRGYVALATQSTATRFKNLTIRDAKGGILCEGVQQLELPD
jgi:hypothetical protein